MGDKEVFLRTYEAQLKDQVSRLESFKAKDADAEPELTIGFEEQAYELEEKVGVARSKMDDIRQSDAPDWKDLKAEAERAMLDLRTALDVAATRFK